MIFTDAAIFECVYEEVLTMAIKKNSEEIYTLLAHFYKLSVIFFCNL